MSVQKIINKFKSRENFQVSDVEITDEEICALEARLKINFPTQYRVFLKQFGYMACVGPCVFGICKNEFEDYFSLEKWTIKARTEKLPADFFPRPKNAVVVCDYGGGGYYFLVCKGSQRGKIILILDELYGKKAPESWASFEEFLEDRNKY